jgi:hypothetical protein
MSVRQIKTLWKLVNAKIQDTFSQFSLDTSTGDLEIQGILREAGLYNDIGVPGKLGFGVGVPVYGSWNSDLELMEGTYIEGHPNYGNFVHTATESVMVYIPPFYVKMNDDDDNWTNGEPLYLIKKYSEYADEATANADGYYLPDGFFNGGDVCGIYIDKYLISKKALGTGYVGASIKYGDPISTHADHNPIADLTACSGNYYYELVNAAHARDGVNGEINTSSVYFCLGNREMQILAILSLAIPKDAYYCAWANSGTTHFPKGCNNNALADTNDTSVVYLSDGYSNCGKTGSANQFAKTTHNGQECGICDLSGPMYMAAFDFTCDATTKSVTNITLGDPTTITCTGHGLTAGDQFMLTSITGADELEDRMWTVLAVVDPDNFTVDVDSSGFVAYTSGGTVTYGTFRGLKRSAKPCDITPGTTETTDLFNPACTLTETVELLFRTDYSNNAFALKLGNTTTPVFDITEKRFHFGFAEADGVSPSGTSQMGNDYWYQYFRNQLVVLLSALWNSGSTAGVGYRNFNYYRTYSSHAVGGRFACHGSPVL